MADFIKKIKNFTFKQNLVIVLSNILNFISILLLIFILIFFIIQIKSGFIFYIVQFIKISIVVIFGIFIYRIYRNRLNCKKSASLLDKRNNDSGETLLNAYELNFEKKGNTQILEKIFSKANEKINHTDLSINFSRLKSSILLFVIILISFGFIYIYSNGFIGETWKYVSRFAPPEKKHKTFVEVSPGNKKIVINSTLTIQVINPEEKVSHTLYYKVDKIWRKFSLENYSKTFDNLDYSFEYFIKTPYAVSDTFHIEVFELPAIKKIKIKYIYPAYTRLKSIIDSSGTGNISAPVGTDVILTITANNPIKKADIFFSYNKHNTMQRLDRKSFNTSFKITQNGYYHIELTDILNNSAEKIQYFITAIKDQYPEVEFLYPAKDTLLTKDMKTPLKIIASDDYGLQNPILHYQINEQNEIKIPLKNFLNDKIAKIDYIFDLSNTELYPGDNIVYWCEISDNNPKPQTSYTTKYSLKFPSIQEIYKAIEKEEEEKQEKLQKAYKKAQKLRKEFDLERRNILKKLKMDWEQKEKLKEILKKQKEVANTVKKVADEYNKLIKKMEKNKTVTKETLEKLKKIEDLMKDINNEKFKDALKKMQEKLKNASMEDVKKALEKMKFSMEDFNKKLEETIKLLKQIKKEQALQKSLELVKEMEKLQKNVNKNTQNKSKSNKELAKMQQKVNDNLQDLQKQLEQSDKLLTDKQDKKIKQALKNLQKQMEKDSLSQNIKTSKMQLSKGEMKASLSTQKKIMQSIQSAKSKLQNMLSMMSSSAGMQMGKSIQNTILRFFLLSSELKPIKEKMKYDPTPYLDILISNYEGFNQALKKLYSTPMITLILGRKFITDASETSSEYQKLFENLSDRKFYDIKGNLKTIYAGYNKMIFDLIQSKNNMSQQSGGMSSGMEAMMQALQQMGQQQMMMNMLTMQMLKQMMNNGGKMSNELRAQAQRLAEEEGRLAENLKRMLQTNQEAQKRSGFLGNIAKELEEISSRLKANKIDNNLIDRQKRILSRLLEAQRSIHKKGFSKKRKSEISEKNFIGIKKNNRQKINEIKLKSLLEDSETDYPIEYRKLIDEYLKKLNENLGE